MCSTGDGSEAGRREGYLYSEAGCGWRMEGVRKQGRAFHLNVEIKCGLFSSSLNNLYQQFKKILPVIYLSIF